MLLCTERACLLLSHCRDRSGHLPLLLNFLCSLKEYKIPLPKHIIFAATKSTAAAVKRLGLTVYWHEALGNFNGGIHGAHMHDMQLHQQAGAQGSWLPSITSRKKMGMPHTTQEMR